MFESKPAHIEIEIDEDEGELMFAIIANLRRRRDSGEDLDLTRISMLEWQLILIWDAEVDAHERNLRIHSKLNFEAQQSWNKLIAARLGIS